MMIIIIIIMKIITEIKMFKCKKPFHPLPHMPVLGSSNSAANINMNK